MGSDYPDRPQRFEVTYHFLSLRWNVRLCAKVWASETEAIPSICSIYPNADWSEREVYDLYGVLFTQHPDLRRILTDYGFQGHPLRKDFPCTGYTETRYDEVEKRVTTESVELAQEFRTFDYTSPWESALGDSEARAVRTFFSEGRFLEDGEKGKEKGVAP